MFPTQTPTLLQSYISTSQQPEHSNEAIDLTNDSNEELRSETKLDGEKNLVQEPQISTSIHIEALVIAAEASSKASWNRTGPLWEIAHKSVIELLDDHITRLRQGDLAQFIKSHLLRISAVPHAQIVGTVLGREIGILSGVIVYLMENRDVGNQYGIAKMLLSKRRKCEQRRKGKGRMRKASEVSPEAEVIMPDSGCKTTLDPVLEEYRKGMVEEFRKKGLLCKGEELEF